MTSDSLLLKRPFRYYIKTHKRTVFFGLLALFLTNLLDALPPLLIGYAIDQIANEKPFGEISLTVAVLFGVTISLATSRFLWRIFWGRFSHSSAMDLQNRIFKKFTRLDQSFLRKNPVGELMSLIINDVNSFRMALGPGTLVLLDAAFILMIVPPIMFSISASWTLKTLIVMPLLPFFTYKMLNLLHHRYDLRQASFSELSGKAQEIINGIRVIKSYGKENEQTESFNESSRKFEETSNRFAKVDAAFIPPLEFAIAIGAVILLLVGAPEVMSGAVSIGAFFAFYQYIDRMEWPATAIGLGLSHLQQGKVSFNRIKKLIDAESSIHQSGTQAVNGFNKLEFKNLSFQYPGQTELALKDISFRINKGEVIGVIGLTGSGKTTLTELIARVLPAPPHTIFINDVPIENYELEELRSLLAFVPQEPFLFGGKVLDNVSFGTGADREEVKRYLQIVDILSEVEGFPHGLHTELGEKGINLSGGQKQRLTIARALIRKAPLVILDDALSAVDASTESKILKSVKDELNGAAIVIAHRINSISFCDQILVLNQGRLEAIGSHDQLLKTSITYSTLHKIQSRGGQI